MKIQNPLRCSGGVVAFLLLASTINLDAQYTYTTLTELPEQASVYGISGTNIVGVCENSNGVTCGFLYNGSNSTILSAPGAVNTYAYGICGTNIVGTYIDTNGIYYGFLYNGSTYTTLSVPGALATWAWGISGTNIVGYYESYDYDNNYLNYNYGFLYNGSTYTTFGVPGALYTQAFGISGTNIVGLYEMDDGLYDYPTYGYLYDGNTYTTLTPPGASGSQAMGISDNGIVGTYSSGGLDYGFIYAGNVYTTLTGLGASGTEAEGISGGQIVGNAWGGVYGASYASFLATPVITLTLAGTPPILSWAAISGFRYDVLFTTNMAVGFQPLATITPTNSVAEWPIATTGTAGFYSVELEP